MSDTRERPQRAAHLKQVLELRLNRRAVLRGLAGLAAADLLPRVACLAQSSAPQAIQPADFPTSLTFPELEQAVGVDQGVAKGYRADVVVRWGDTIRGKERGFSPPALDVRDQARQFGYNCDFIAYMPLPRGSDQRAESDHGLLCVNHEYTNPHLMWAGMTARDRLNLTKEQCEYEMHSHGHSVVEVRKIDGRWRVVQETGLSRRISVMTPSIQMSGPAAGHRRLCTNGDPSGMSVEGTLNNCAGGVTPWHTVLLAEENFNKYFTGDITRIGEVQNYQRYNIVPKYLEYSWWKHFERFNIDVEPREPNRFGWVVEFDPYDVAAPLMKRTALGRLKHEGCAVVLNHDNRVVIYMGDDEENEYVYRYVSTGRFAAGDEANTRRLLDQGVLSVARFEADGTLRWLALVWGKAPLDQDNGFTDQGDVLIETRRSADLLGATPMDSPEDVEVSPMTGRVYVMLTENLLRREEQVNAANPRARNRFGHVVEMIPPDAGDGRVDHSAEVFHWNVFLKAGDPAVPEHGAEYHPGVTRNGWLACPDNAVFDRRGRLWICTDHGGLRDEQPCPDGIWATETVGGGKALTRMFFAGPMGSEITGPCFTPDGRTLFASVQHPGETKGSTFDAPSTRWPDFQPGMPPRPSVIAIQKEDGGEFGS